MRVYIEIIDWNKYQNPSSREENRVSWFKSYNSFYRHSAWDELGPVGRSFFWWLLMYASDHEHKTGAFLLRLVSLRRDFGLTRRKLITTLCTLENYGLVSYRIVTAESVAQTRIERKKEETEHEELNFSVGEKREVRDTNWDSPPTENEFLNTVYKRVRGKHFAEKEIDA